jgi:hypothetical protein
LLPASSRKSDVVFTTQSAPAYAPCARWWGRVHVIGRVEDPGPYKAPLLRAKEAAALASSTAARTADLLAGIKPLTLGNSASLGKLGPTAAGACAVGSRLLHASLLSALQPPFIVGARVRGEGRGLEQ